MGVILRERKLPSGNTQLYLDIHRYVAKGEYARKTEALFVLKKGDTFENREKRRMAEEVRSNRSLELEALAFGLTATQKRTASFIQYFEEQAGIRTGNTAVTWRNALKHFRVFSGENLTFAQLTPTFFEKFKAYLLKQVSPNSAQVYFARIKTTLHQAVRDGILTLNPASSVTIRGEAILPVYLTLVELRKLSRAPCPNEQVKRAFLFASFTGMRYSDVSRLTWDQINGGDIKFKQRKTGEEEVIPLTEQAKHILKKQRKAKPSSNLVREQPEGVVFYLPSQPVMDRQIKRWGANAGLKKSLSFHKARHSYGMLARRQGIPLQTIRGLLGHKSTQMTERYARLDEFEMQKAVKKIPRL